MPLKKEESHTIDSLSIQIDKYENSISCTGFINNMSDIDIVTVSDGVLI